VIDVEPEDKMFTEAQIDTKSFNDDEKSFVAWASRPVKDRDDELINADAWDLRNYKKNPVVMWAHDYKGRPVGRSMWIKPEEDGLKFKPQFAKTEAGEETYQLYKDGILKAFSVGFVPHEWEDAEEKEAKAGKPKRTYTKVELLEISCVPIPSCPDALVEAYESGRIKTKALNDAIADMLENDPAKDADEVSDVEMKPYANEHACRLQDPGKYDNFARQNCKAKSDGKCIDFIFGIKGGKSELQAMRYKKDVWTADAAKSHCSGKGGSFEAAKSVDEYIRLHPEDRELLEKAIELLSEKGEDAPAEIDLDAIVQAEKDEIPDDIVSKLVGDLMQRITIMPKIEPKELDIRNLLDDFPSPGEILKTARGELIEVDE
jgi:HK97 family phage prohead protease